MLSNIKTQTIIDPDQLLDQNQVAKLLKVSKKFLEAKRCNGGGPVYIKVGHLARYRLTDVQAWIESQRKTSTSLRSKESGHER